MKKRRGRRPYRSLRKSLERRIRGQHLEDRVLLAADPSLAIDPAHSAALIAGFNQLDRFGDRLGTSEPLSTFVPLARIAGWTAATTPSIGSQLDIGTILADAVSTPATTYLESNPHPTADGLARAILDAGLDISLGGSDRFTTENVMVENLSDAQQIQFQVSLTARRSEDIEIDFAEQLSDAAAELRGTFATPLQLQYNLSTTITSTMVTEQTAEATFAFDGTNSIVATLDHQQQEALTGDFGFLGFEIHDGVVDYDFSVGLDFSGHGVDGIRAIDLASKPLQTLFEFDLSGANAFHADLPMIVHSNGFDIGANPAATEQPRIVIQDGDLFDGQFDHRDPYFTVENASHLADFKTVTAVGIYTALQTIQDIFVAAGQNESFQKELPFTGGTTLADVLDVATAFGENLIAPLGLTPQSTTSSEGVAEASRNDEPGFKNVQQLVNRLASKIHYSPDDDGDGSTHDPVITFDVDLHHLFDVFSVDASFDFPLEEVDGIETSSTIEVEAELDSRFQVGILLRRTEGGLPLTKHTPLGQLNGGDGVDLSTGTLDLRLRDGRLVEIDLTSLDHDSTLGELIEAIEVQARADEFRHAALSDEAQRAIAEDPIFKFIPVNNLDDNGKAAGMLRVVITEQGDALELVDTTHIDIFGGELRPTPFSVEENTVARQLGLASGRGNDEGLTGRPINGRFALDDNTPLDDLNRGRGIEILSPAEPSDPAIEDLTIRVASGASFSVDLTGAVTVGDVITAIHDAAAAATDPVTGAAVALNVPGDVQVTYNSDHTGLAIIDRTGGTGRLRVTGENGSLAVVGLGIAGTGVAVDEGPQQRIEGLPLHGRTLADNVFIRQLAAAAGPAAVVTPGDTMLYVGREVAAAGSHAKTTETERIEVDAGTDLSGVFPGDRIELSFGGNTTTHEIVSVDDRSDIVHVAHPVSAGDFSWEIHNDVNLSRVVAGDQVHLAGRTDGIDGSDLFAVVWVDDVSDTIGLDTAPTDPGETTSWSIDRLAPMLSGTGRLIGDNIDAEAMLGFVEIAITDGRAVGQLTADISLGDTGTDDFDDRVTLGEAMDGLQDVALKIVSKNEITFPQTIAETYGGVLKLVIAEPTADSSDQTVIPIPFYVPPMPPPRPQANDAAPNAESSGGTTESELPEEDPLHLRARAIAAQLNLSMVAVEAIRNIRAEAGRDGTIRQNQLRDAIDAIGPPRVMINASGDRLNVTLTDGVARPLAVSPGQLSDITSAIGLSDQDVELVMRLLANVPGLPVDHSTGIDDLVDSDEALRKLGFDSGARVDDLAAYVARPRLSGSGQLDLPVDMHLDLAGLSLPTGLPEIHIGIPDLSLDDFSLPGALDVDLGELGDVAALGDLSLADIVRVMQAGLGFLEGLEEFKELEFLNADLPLIDLNLRDMMQIADAFGDIVIQLETNPVAGLGLVEEFLEDAIGLPEDKGGDAGKPAYPVFTIPELNEGLPEFAGINLSDPLAYLSDPDADLSQHPDLDSFLQSIQGGDAGAVELSLDRQGSELAVRIDIGLELAQIHRQAGLSIGLDSLGVPGVSHLVGTSAGGQVDVNAGARISLSLGLDLTHSRGVQPFLYDMQGSGASITGTRIEILADAMADDLRFSAAVGPLGVEVAGGSLDILGPIDVDPDTGRGKAKFTVGLGALFAETVFGFSPEEGDGRHYLDEIVARGDTIAILSGKRAELTENNPQIVLPPTTDLSQVFTGDRLVVGEKAFVIEAVDPVAATVTTATAPTESIASAAWEILRDTEMASGNGALVAQNLTTVALPVTADLSRVQTGDRLTLVADSAGEHDVTIEIVELDHATNTLRLGTAPQVQDGAYAWVISRPGDFEFLLDITDLQIDARGWANADLPLSFPALQGIADAGLTATVGDLTDITSIHVEADGIFGDAIDILRGNFNLSAVVGGWNTTFGFLTEAMRSQVLGMNIPLIGDALQEQADFLDRLNESVGGNLESNQEDGKNDSLSVRQALYDALGPGGLNWLRDLDTSGNTGIPVPDGAITIDDIVMRAETDSDNPGFIFDFQVGQDLVDLSIPGGFDLGIPGLNLNLDAPVDARLGFDMRITMGLNLRDGFYIQTGAAGSVPEIQVYLDVAVPGLDASGQLAYLRIDAHDLPTPQVTVGGGDAQLTIFATRPDHDLEGVSVRLQGGARAGQEEIQYDDKSKELVILIEAGVTTAEAIVALVNSQGESTKIARDFRAEVPLGTRGRQPLAEASGRTVASRASGFRGTFGVDIVDPNNDDGKITTAEMLRAGGFDEVVEVRLDGVADLNFALSVDMTGIDFFPSIRTNFGLDWNIGLDVGVPEPIIQFTDVEMNLGQFFGDFVAPILGKAQDVLGPTQPVIDVLAGPLPVISDLAGTKISAIDLGKLYGGTANIAGFLDGVAQLVTLINALPDVEESEWLNFGGFRYDIEIDRIVEVYGPAKAIFDRVREVASNFDPSDLTGDGGGDDEFHLDFPVLTNPKLLFDLMLGKDVDLFTLELPTFELEANVRQFYPIPAFPVLGAELRGLIGAEIDMAFGYDTSGLRRYFHTGSKTSVADGFYLFDHENSDGSGDDIPELTVSAGISAGPAAQVAAASVTVQGGVFADVFFDLHDNNEDGKIRGLELLDNSLLDNSLIHIFDVSGVLDARLFAALEVGTGIFKVTKSFSIAEVELLSYDLPRPDGNTVPLADREGSTLVLNIGPRASLRNNPVIDLLDPDHDEDNNEQLTIQAGAEPGSVVLTMLGREQTFRGITKIVGDAGLGDDTITVGDSLTIPVHIHGGPGSDTIRGGAGSDRIFGHHSDNDYYVGMSAGQLADGENTLEGGSGDDILVGGALTDHLRGGDGNDIIRGGGGGDLLLGGEGDDTIDGEDGDDTLKGEGGDDLLRGGQGNDLLEGATGSDRLLGGGDHDRLVGGRDGDTLDGQSGDDVLLGDEGADVLSGGTGTDVVFGGVGNDTIFGGSGDDQLFGENSRDTIFGDDGNDLIVGGPASDDLFGGRGDDRIHASDQLNSDDDAEHLIHGGGGEDLIFAGSLSDRIFGDGENDAQGTTDPSTDGGDVIYALAGDDVVVAGGGDDRIFGGLGADDIWGGRGNDRIYATNELDAPDPGNAVGSTMVGGPGDDLIRAQLGAGLDLDDVIDGDGPVSPTASANPALDGDDVIFAFGGNDTIHAGHGNNIVDAGDGNDTVTAGDGQDLIDAAGGHDWVVAGLGDDKIIGGSGNDVLFGGLATGTSADFNLADPSNFVSPPGYAENELLYPTGYLGADIGTRPMFLFPALLTGSVFGRTGDGRDRIDAGEGIDFVFGGADADVLDGGGGPDFVDAGGGSDLDVRGGAGDDIILGGQGDDALQGGEGIDQVYGNVGDDIVFGEPAGSSQIDVLGQRLYGNDGRDQLYAFAPEGATPAPGEQLFGGNDGDFLRGNLLNEVLVGGNGNDFMHGDALSGNRFLANPDADRIGGHDLLLGGSGEDQLFGGGGNDEIWGGADSDIIEGQAGSDDQYGGSEIDLFVAPTGFGQAGAAPADRIDGHFGNVEQGDIEDDNATDILVINGTSGDDTILLSQTSSGRLHVTHPNGDFDVDWLAADGTPLIEQFQIAGLGGDDIMGFAIDREIPGLDALRVPAGFEPLDLRRLGERSRDFVGVLDGNSGNDLLVGGSARDRLDGGRGSDILMGFAGDDRLWGDGGEAIASDHDVMFAGAGNDDLIGGGGRNTLYAWSFAPDPLLTPTPGDGFSAGDMDRFLESGPDAQFGVFVDSEGYLYQGSDPGNRDREITGLNRIVGGHRDDHLFGGTALDFLFGNGGSDTLFRSSGTAFTSLDGGLAGNQWKEYARQSDRVWYVGGTNANDEITVDFVTEPGVLADHHLITRLTDNNGNVSFSAQVRLDFDAIDARGNAIWDAEDTVIDAAARLESLEALKEIGDDPDDETRGPLLAGFEQSTIALNEGLLPAEGDFLAIVIDALGGNDEITVGPTVQKSVWIDAGAGDDRVEIRGGNPILVDRGEHSISPRGLRGRNDSVDYSFNLLDIREGNLIAPGGRPVLDGAVFTGLTIDNPQDEDWFALKLAIDIGESAEAQLQLASGSPIDRLKLELFEFNPATGDLISVNDSTFQTSGDRSQISLAGLSSETEYRLRVSTPNVVPTPYDLRFDLLGNASEADFAAMPLIELQIGDGLKRRDVIVGGEGNDILQGGAGEDFIFGGAGDDVLTGGKDRNAGDVIFAGPGDDTFQIIPDALPLLGNQPGTQFDPGTATYLPTFNDQFRGDRGDDRVLFLGGDLDRTGKPVPDFVSLRYNTALHRYEFTSLVWDIANQQFITDPDNPARFEQHFSFFQTDDVEYSQIITQAGDDVVRADPTFRFLPIVPGSNPTEIDTSFDPSLLSEWGIDLGDTQQRAVLASLDIRGGLGDDHLFGGAEADRIDGGDGDDVIVGSHGNDLLRGGSGNDYVIGFDDSSASAGYPPQVGTTNLPQELFAFELATPLLDQRDHAADLANPLRTGSLGDAPALIGDQPGERLGTLTNIGDFDGDSFDDFLAVGRHFSYVFLRPVEITGTQNVREFAEIVIHHESAGRPAQSQGDINGDRISDLVLLLPGETGTTMTTVYGSSDATWDRNWDARFITQDLTTENSHRAVFSSGVLAPQGVDGHVLNYDGDGFADVLITSSTTEGTVAAQTATFAPGVSASFSSSFHGRSAEAGGRLFFASGGTLYGQDVFGRIKNVAAVDGDGRPVVVGNRVYVATDRLNFHDHTLGISGSHIIFEQNNHGPDLGARIAPETLAVNVSNGSLLFSGRSAQDGRYYLFQYDPSRANSGAGLDDSNGPLQRITLDGKSSGKHLWAFTETLGQRQEASSVLSRLYFAAEVDGKMDLYSSSGGSSKKLNFHTDRQGKTIRNVTQIGETLVFEDDLYFVARVDGKRQIWRYNKNSSSHPFTQVSNVPGSQWNPKQLTPFQGAIYFESFGELWRYSPSGGVEQVVDLDPLGAWNPANFAVDGNKLYFTAKARDSTETRLWRYDGVQFVELDSQSYDPAKGVVAGGGTVLAVDSAGDLVQFGRGNLGYLLDGASIAADTFAVEDSIPIRYDGPPVPETGGFSVAVLGDINGDGRDDIAFHDPDFAPLDFRPATITASRPVRLDVLQSGDYQVDLRISVENTEDASRTVTHNIQLQNESISDTLQLVSRLNTLILDSPLAGLVTAGLDVASGNLSLTTHDGGSKVSITAEGMGDFSNPIGFRTHFPAVFTMRPHSFPIRSAGSDGNAEIFVNGNRAWVSVGGGTIATIHELIQRLREDVSPSFVTFDVVLDERSKQLLQITTAATGSDVELFIESDSNSSIIGAPSDRDCDDNDGGNSQICTRYGSSIEPIVGVGQEILLSQQAGYRGIHLADPNASMIRLSEQTHDEFSVPATAAVIGIGDINLDGIGDWASTSLDGNGATQIELSLGLATGVTDAPTLTFTTEVHQNAPSLAVGDWNHDGQSDLAIGFAGDGVSFAAEVQIIQSIGGLIATPGTISLASVVDRSLGVTGDLADQTELRLSESMDFNGDQHQDLLVGLPALASENGSASRPTGLVYAVYGTPDVVPLPTQDTVSLATISVPGSGAYLVDRGTGQPSVFGDAEPFRVTDSQPAWFEFGTLGDGKPGQWLRVAASSDVTVRLYDSGGVLVRDSSRLLDLRGVAAGDYFLRVDTSSTQPVEFTIEVQAPIRGQSHASALLPDRDQIYGDGGNDILAGNFDIDSIQGGTGSDTVFGESIELRDRQIIDDPVILNSSNSQHSINSRPKPIDPLVMIPDSTLRSMLPTIDGRIRASELAQLEVLVQTGSGLKVRDLSGLEAAFNLTTLVLADQDLDSDDLVTLTPTMATSGLLAGQPIGMPRLELLDLSGNSGVTDISALQGLSNLRTLNLMGTSVDVLHADTLRTLESLDRLDELFLPVSFLSGAADFAVTEGDRVSLGFDVGGTWSVTDASGSTVADSHSLQAAGGPDQPAMISAMTDAPSSGRLADVESDIEFEITFNGTPTNIVLPSVGLAGARLVGGSDGLMRGEEFVVQLDDGITVDSQIVSVPDGSYTTVDLIGIFMDAFDTGPLAGRVFASTDGENHFILSSQGVGSNYKLSIGANLGLGLQDLGFPTSGTFFTRSGKSGNATYNNASISDLASDLTAALAEHGLDGQVFVTHADRKLRFETHATGADTRIKIDPIGDLAAFGFLTDAARIEFTPNDNGIFLVEHSGASPTRFPVVVTNGTPTFEPIVLAVEIYEGSELSFSLDAERNVLEYQLVRHDALLHQNAAVAFDDPGGNDRSSLTHHIAITTPDHHVHQLSEGALRFDQQGTYRIELHVVDKDGGVTSQSRLIDVINVAPVAVHGGGEDERTVIVAGSSVSLDGTASFDPGSDPLAFHWEITTESGVPTLTSDRPRLEFSPIQSGRYFAQLTVTDDEGLSSTVTQTIDVLPAIDVHVLDRVSGLSIDQQVTAGQSLLFSATDPWQVGTRFEPPGRVRRYAWEVRDQSGASVLTSEGETIHFIPNSGGTHHVELTVTDVFGTGLDVTQLQNSTTFPLEVENTKIEILVPSGTLIEGADVNLGFTGIGPPADMGPAATREVTWRVFDGVGNFVAADNNAEFTFRAPDNGSFEIFVDIEDTFDGFTTIHTGSTNINVANAAPKLGASDFFVIPPGSGDADVVPSGRFEPNDPSRSTVIGYEGMELYMPISVNDPGIADFHLIEWEVHDSAGGLLVGGVGSDFSYVPTDNGELSVSIRMTDDEGDVANATVAIQVENVAPEINAGPDQVLLENEVGSEVNFTGTLSDLGYLDGPHHIAWDFGDGSGMIETSGSETTPTHNYSESGTYSVKLTVTDKDGAVSVDELVVHIVNQPPVIETLVSTGRRYDAGETVTIAGVVTDHVGDQLRASIAFGDGQQLPVVLHPIEDQEFVRRYAFEVSHEFLRGGVFHPVLTVRDADGAFIELRGLSISVSANQAPSAITLAQTQVRENIAGAVIGAVTTTDPDASNSHTFDVSDPRFEVSEGLLKLRRGVLVKHADAAQIELTITATDSGSPRLAVSETIVVDVSENPNPFQNPISATDANNDGTTTALDALKIINSLTSLGLGDLPEVGEEGKMSYVDVNGDGHITALDALIVINSLRRSTTQSESERLALPPASTVSSTSMEDSDARLNPEQALIHRIDRVHAAMSPPRSTKGRGGASAQAAPAPASELPPQLDDTISLLSNDRVQRHQA